ncbi:hypothetical protein CR513_05264, partial [Mucuna pruriens]
MEVNTNRIVSLNDTNCFLWKKENKDKNGKSKEKDHDDDDDRVTITIGDDLVILRDFELVNFVSNESMWIIDSGATLHVIPRKEFFTSYTSGDFGVLKMGNDGVTKTKVSFNKHPPSRKSKLLELVHSDVCGPLKAKKSWVYVLKTMDQVLEKFKLFQALVERQTSEKVKCIRPNNGEVHVINLSPAVALNTEVPDKIWFDKDVKYDHLQVFGCKAFVHVPKDEKSKLDMKTKQCIFIEYGHDEYGYRMYDLVEKNEYGYRMYDLVEKKLVKSRDVQFMEDQTIEDIDKVKKTTLEKDNSLSKIDLVWMPIHDLDIVDNNEQHNYVGDQHLGDGFDIDDTKEEQEMSRDENLGDAPEPPP